MSDIINADNFMRSRFTVYRYGRPWLVAFSKGFASGIVSAIKARGEESSYHEGVERPSKRSYEHSARMVLAPVKKSPQRRHSAPSERVHYWGDGGLRDRPHKYLVETYDIRLKSWVTTTSYDWQCVAESVRKPHQRIRVVADAATGYKTVQILHDDPRF